MDTNDGTIYRNDQPLFQIVWTSSDHIDHWIPLWRLQKAVSTGVLSGLDEPLVVQTKIWKSGWSFLLIIPDILVVFVLMLSTNCDMKIQIVVIQQLPNSTTYRSCGTLYCATCCIPFWSATVTNYLQISLWICFGIFIMISWECVHLTKNCRARKKKSLNVQTRWIAFNVFCADAPACKCSLSVDV